MIRIALLAALALGGCTTTAVEYNRADGSTVSLNSNRLWTATYGTLRTPEMEITYSSNPDAAAAASQMDRLLGIIEQQALPERLRAVE